MTKKSVILFTCVLGLFWAATAAADGPKWMLSKTKELVERARAETKHISIQELKKAIDEDMDVVVLDVRTPKEFEAVHIPEAVNPPRGLLEFAIWSLVPNQQETRFLRLADRCPGVWLCHIFYG